MPLYESTFIARPDISPQQVDGLAEQLQEVVRDGGGEIAKTEYWGLRSLAYRIKKNRKGHYYFMNIDAPPDAIAELERTMRISEDVIRYLTVRVDAHDPNPAPLTQSRGRGRGEGRGGRRGSDDRGDRGDRPRATASEGAPPATDAPPASTDDEKATAKDDAKTEAETKTDVTAEAEAPAAAEAESAGAEPPAADSGTEKSDSDSGPAKETENG